MTSTTSLFSVRFVTFFFFFFFEISPSFLLSFKESVMVSFLETRKRMAEKNDARIYIRKPIFERISTFLSSEPTLLI